MMIYGDYNVICDSNDCHNYKKLEQTTITLKMPDAFQNFQLNWIHMKVKLFSKYLFWYHGNNKKIIKKT